MFPFNIFLFLTLTFPKMVFGLWEGLVIKHFCKEGSSRPLMLLGLCGQKSADKWPIHAGASAGTCCWIQWMVYPWSNFSCLDQGWGRIQVLLCLIFVLSFCHVFSRMPLALNQHPCMWALKEPCGWCALCAWPLHPTLGTWLRHLPVEKGLLHTVFFNRATSALSVALNFCDTPEASAKEGRAQVSDTLPPFSLLFHSPPPPLSHKC